MAQPSHDRGDRDRDRDRTERTERVHRSASSAHHHHRTISSTTLLLVLSLILAVLAVMLSIPSTSSTAAVNTAAAAAAAAQVPPSEPTGLWGYLTPKRSQALVQRESAVALREAEVARREADLLLGSPAGVGLPSVTTIIPGCATEEVYITNTVTVAAPAQTIYKEVIKEIESIAAPLPPPVNPRLEELIDREHKISAREKDVGKREETVGRRESDASRREAWIMDQLIALGNEDERPTVEEEIIYETQTTTGKRKPKPATPKKPIEATILKPVKPVKEAPPPPPPSPPPVPIEVIHHVTTTVTMVPATVIVSETETQTATVTVAAAPPNHTRLAANPVPQKNLFDGAIPTPPPAGPTRVVEVTVEAVVPSPTTEQIVTEETVVPLPVSKVAKVVVEQQQQPVVEEEEEEEVDEGPQRTARRTVTVRSGARTPKAGGRRGKAAWLPHW